MQALVHIGIVCRHGCALVLYASISVHWYCVQVSCFGACVWRGAVRLPCQKREALWTWGMVLHRMCGPLCNLIRQTVLYYNRFCVLLQARRFFKQVVSAVDFCHKHKIWYGSNYPLLN